MLVIQRLGSCWRRQAEGSAQVQQSAAHGAVEGGRVPA